MTFADPHWLMLLLLLPVLAAVKAISRRRGSQGVDRFVAPRLQERLVKRTPAANDWTVSGLQMMALLCFILAMARPQAGFQLIETSSTGRNVLIALDTSRSMLSQDVLPDRLDRARLASTDLVRSLPADRIGLIAFAGQAFLQAPLTVDHDAVLETIEQMDTEIIPRGGTNVARAIELSLEALNDAQSNEGALVLFSDGEDLEGNEQLDALIQTVKEAGLIIVAIGVGTETGGIIPDPTAEEEGVFVKDNRGEIVRTRLNPVTLTRLATESGGVYLNLGGNGSVSTVVQSVLSGLERKRQESEETRVPIERYAIPLTLGLLFLISAYLVPMHPRLKRQPPAIPVTGVSLWVVMALVLSFSSLHAQKFRESEPDLAMPSEPTEDASVDGETEDSSATNGRYIEPGPAIEAYREEAWDVAMKRYQSEADEATTLREQTEATLGLGASAFQAEDYETAREAFGNMLRSPNRKMQERAHHNLGNTLYEVGAVRLEEALKEAGPPEGPQTIKLPDGKEAESIGGALTDEQREAIRQQWQSSMEHFNSTLKLNRWNQRARRNMEFVNRQIQLLEPPPPPENEDEENEDDENEDEEEDEENEDDNQDDQNENDDQQDQDNNNNPNQNPNNNSQNPSGNQNPQQNPTPPNQMPPSPPEANPGEQPPGENESPPESEQQQQPGQPGQPEPISPSRARQILEQHSDEDPNARIQPLVPHEDERYKNW